MQKNTVLTPPANDTKEALSGSSTGDTTEGIIAQDTWRTWWWLDSKHQISLLWNVRKKYMNVISRLRQTEVFDIPWVKIKNTPSQLMKSPFSNTVTKYEDLLTLYNYIIYIKLTADYIFQHLWDFNTAVKCSFNQIRSFSPDLLTDVQECRSWLTSDQAYCMLRYSVT